MRSRLIVPLIVIALVALHQLFLNGVVPRVAPEWRVPVEVTVYGLTGIVATWIGLTGLGRALARRERAESELRAAFDELEFNHQKLLVLHDLGERVAAAPDEQSVIELAAQAPLKLTGACASTVVTFDDERDHLKLDMAWGLSENYLRALRARMDAGVPAGRCRACTVLKTRVTSNCPLFVDLQSVAQTEGIHSLVCLPIAHEQERVGVISAYFPSVEGPPEDHVRLLNILGKTIATTLDSLRVRARQVGTLHAIDRATQNTDALGDLAAQVLDIVAMGWEAQSGGLFLYDAEAQTWTCRARRGLGDALTDPRFDLGLQLARQAHALSAPVILPDLGSAGEHGLLSAAAVPLMAEGKAFGAIFLGAKRRRALVEHHTELLTTMAHQIALAMRNAQLYAQLGQMAVLEERYRLSREIHDGLAQTLGYLGLQAERLEQLIAAGRSDAVTRELGEMRQSIRAAYVDAREAIDGLRLSVENPSHIAERLADYAAEFARQTGLTTHFEVEPSDLTTDPAISLQLLRIAQEALTNIRKHAQAQRVDVCLRAAGAEIELSVTDDGRGLPDSTAPGHTFQSHGLATMRERAESMGGALTIATGPKQGTRIGVTIPFKKRDALRA